MSAKRNLLENEESYGALQSLFLEIAEGRLALDDELWRRVLEDPWFKREVSIQATRIVERWRVDAQWRDDISQEIAVFLKRKLSNRAEPPADAAQLRDHFPGWARTMIKNACSDILKHQLPHPHAALTDAPLPNRNMPLDDLRLDVAEATARLDERSREVVLLWLRRCTHEEIARLAGLSPRQVGSVLLKARRSLARLLAAYRPEDDERQTH